MCFNWIKKVNDQYNILVLLYTIISVCVANIHILATLLYKSVNHGGPTFFKNTHWIPHPPKHGSRLKNRVSKLIRTKIMSVGFTNIDILATLLYKSGNPDGPTLF